MRSHLMQNEYVAVFCELLKNLSDGIEISYNSAGKCFFIFVWIVESGKAWETKLPGQSGDQGSPQAVSQCTRHSKPLVS